MAVSLTKCTKVIIREAANEALGKETKKIKLLETFLEDLKNFIHEGKKISSQKTKKTNIGEETTYSLTAQYHIINWQRIRSD